MQIIIYSPKTEEENWGVLVGHVNSEHSCQERQQQWEESWVAQHRLVKREIS